MPPPEELQIGPIIPFLVPSLMTLTMMVVVKVYGCYTEEPQAVIDSSFLLLKRLGSGLLGLGMRYSLISGDSQSPRLPGSSIPSLSSEWEGQFNRSTIERDAESQASQVPVTCSPVVFS